MTIIENSKFAVVQGSDTYSRALNCFYKRSSVSAWRLACMMFHLWCMDDKVNGSGLMVNGISCVEESINHKLSTINQIKGKVIKFYRFMATYILEGLLDEWGKQYEQMHKTDDVEEGPKVTLYDQLPQRFSRDQLRELVVKLDLSCPVRTFIFKWKRAKLIYEDPDEKDVFVKNY